MINGYSVKNGRKGFTLLEVMMVLFIIAIITPVLGLAFYQLVTLPGEETNRLTVSNEIHLVASWIISDGQKSEAFVEGNGSVFGQFRWTDYVINQSANESVREYEVTYILTNNVVRRYETVSWFDFTKEIYINNSKAIDIARHINSLDSNFSAQGLEVTINAGVSTKISKTETIYVTSRINYAGTETAGLPWGPNVVLAGNSNGAITISGRANFFAGPLHSDGDIIVTGQDDAVQGDVMCSHLTGNLKVIAPGEIIQSPNNTIWGMPHIDPVNPSEYTFDWTGNVNLENKLEVWDTSNPTQLLPGIYHCNGTLTVGRQFASGTVTFIADKILLNSGYCNLQPYRNDLLCWANASGQDVIVIDYAKESYQFWRTPGIFQGVLYAPNGEIELRGSGSKKYDQGILTEGAIVAKEVTISGDYWYLNRW
jgi:prepilin-type N-terminal cleavage/methylation domain-containing protein